MHAGPPVTISVITVCRNTAASIETTIQSVLWQDYPQLEYVVVDGMSTDGTWQIVEKHIERISVTVHEPDGGIYHAMNKGLRLSHGDVVVFMNANDYFVSPYVLSRVARVFREQPELDIVYGDYIADFGQGQLAARQTARADRRHFLLGRNLLHQSMFCRRRAFDRVGAFDESLAIMADRDWNIRALVGAGLPYCHLPLLICVFDTHGVGNTERVRSALELRTVLDRHFHGRERQWGRVSRYVLGLRDRTLFRLRTGNLRPPRFVRDAVAHLGK